MGKVASARTCSFFEKNLVNYYNAWKNLPNATLYEGGDYLNLFATSDAMITDSDSFMSEYLYSGNPGLYLTNPLQKFNEYGEIIKNAWYQIDGTDFEQIENIHNNLVNGNRQDCVKLIKKYGLYDFWSDYRTYLADICQDHSERFSYFSEMTISYFRITNR